MTSIAASTRRALWALAVLCAVLIVTALVLVVTRSGSAALPAGSPQAAAQTYAAAYLDGELDEVRSLSVQAGTRPCGGTLPAQQPALELLSVSEEAQTAQVKVRVTDSSLDSPWSLAGGGYEDQFELVRRDGAWKVSVAPWQFALCTDEGMGY